ncbi:uncharacterized protein LOC143877603 [Tasmannia lanceolata]|uniref:uncharacterized protein LOC143877603 n=1 Tax=Tasmannia lanceolata TaxID=3420 RepID=UPI004062C464
MRDFASCFGEHAIKVSDASCSGSSTSSIHLPAIQNTVSSLYKTNLSTQKQLLVTITWRKNLMGQGLSVHVDDDPSSLCKIDTKSWSFWKKKGTTSFESCSIKIHVFWDLSLAKYGSGPEPVEGFYVVVIADSELILLLGDMGEETARKKFNPNKNPIADFFLIGRKEYVTGKTLYSTRAQFHDRGKVHDILIRCKGEYGGLKDPELLVIIDQKKVVHVKRLHWKFRGNQTIFVDGLAVDMMWDVHNWFFGLSSGEAVFMFRTRSGLESRVWLEEKEKERVGFSLLIYACDSP